MADPQPIPKRRGFADPEVRKRAAAARAAKSKAAKAERAPKRKAPAKKDVEAVIALVVGGIAGTEDYTDPADQSAQAQQIRAAVERIRSWCPPPDRLEPFETEMVADVAAEELVQRPKLIEPFMALADRAKGAKVLFVCLAIAIPRLVNHGAIPAFIGRLIYPPVLTAAGRKAEASFEEPPAPPPPSRGMTDDPERPFVEEDGGSVESA